MSPSESIERLRTCYATCDEWRRLDSPAGELELLRTLTLLDRYLPAGSCVLELGGGPGRYTVELARRGHALPWRTFLRNCATRPGDGSLRRAWKRA